MKKQYSALLASILYLACISSTLHGQDILADLENLETQAKTLTDERAILKSEAEKLSQQEQEIAEEKASLGPAGPFYVFTGQYSNSQARRGGGEAEVFGGAPQGGQEFATFGEAHDEAMRHMTENSSKQPSYRIEDSSGTNLDNSYEPGSLESLSASADPAAKAAVEEKEAGLAAQRQQFDEGLNGYQGRRAEFTSGSDKLRSDIEQADVTALRTAALTLVVGPEQLAASPALTAADSSLGTTVDDGSAAAFVETVTGVGERKSWQKGDAVAGNGELAPGSPIATFGRDGKYQDGKGGHSAVYVKQDSGGLWVFDQYKTGGAKPEQKSVDLRYLPLKPKAGAPLANGASAYFSIKTK